MSARRFDICEAKADLSKLVDAAAAGEEIILVRNGRPLARLIAYQESADSGQGRGFGSDPALVVSEDFDEPLAEEHTRLTLVDCRFEANRSADAKIVKRLGNRHKTTFRCRSRGNRSARCA